MIDMELQSSDFSVEALYLLIPDFLFGRAWGKGKIQEHSFASSLGSVNKCGFCPCFTLVERVKIVFNIATQIAVYHLKYRIRSEAKGHEGHYTLVTKGLSLFSFYCMSTNHFLKAKIGNSPLCFF